MRRAKSSPRVAQKRCFLPDRRAGLIVDVPEERIISDLALASELAKKLQPFNVQLAIDEFGRGHTMLAQFEKLSFAELKLARKHVIDCGVDKSNAPLCPAMLIFEATFHNVLAGRGTGSEPARFSKLS
jgi:EAL domain-containing protein (putative c-di-GMP-specific phosphodiesterase class I)